MGISTIPNPLFVECTKCIHRRKQKQMNPSGHGSKSYYVCARLRPYKRLYGQKGCSRGRGKYKE